MQTWSRRNWRRRRGGGRGGRGQLVEEEDEEEDEDAEEERSDKILQPSPGRWGTKLVGSDFDLFLQPAGHTARTRTSHSRGGSGN